MFKQTRQLKIGQAKKKIILSKFIPSVKKQIHFENGYVFEGYSEMTKKDKRIIRYFWSVPGIDPDVACFLHYWDEGMKVSPLVRDYDFFSLPWFEHNNKKIFVNTNEIKHTAHSSYRCQYHIVFAPKYRRK